MVDYLLRKISRRGWKKILSLGISLGLSSALLKSVIKFEAENGIATKFYLKNVLTKKEKNANVTLCYITIFQAA